MTTNASERRIERAMLDVMLGRGAVSAGTGTQRGRLDGAGGWVLARAEQYDRALALDPAQLMAFLEATQLTTEEERAALDLRAGGTERSAFLRQLSAAIGTRGVVDVLRHGVEVGPVHVDLFYGRRASARPPSPRRFTQNRFSILVRPGADQDGSATGVDLCLCINGLPVATVVLQDGQTRQSADDAVAWYRRVDPSADPLLQPGRCMVHLAIGEQHVYVCAELRGEQSVFHSFDQGSSESAGNPSNLFGIPTDYLWRRILTRPGIMDIIEHYAQMMAVHEPGGEAERVAPVFPRYHQLEVVRRLLASAEEQGVGRRYLMQHSAGSGTATTIAWLVPQLVGVQQDGIRIYDAVFVISDRALERQLGDTVAGFQSGSARLDAAGDVPAQTRTLVERGVGVILANVAHLAGILEEIGAHQQGRRFAFILDESPTPGEAAASLSVEDRVNDAISGSVPLPNTSIFVFAPHANDATLALFGDSYNDRGTIKHRPFHQFTA